MGHLKRHIVHLHVGLCLMSVVALLSLNFVIPQRAELASTYIQTASDTKKSSEPSPTSVSATFGAGATAGNLIVAILGAGGNVTLNAPSGFSTAINQSGTPSQAIFYKTAAGGETAITATVSSNPSSIGLHIYEYSGGDNTLDLTSSSSGFGTSTVSGTNLTRSVFAILSVSSSITLKAPTLKMLL